MLDCGEWNKYKRFWDEGMDWNKTKKKQSEKKKKRMVPGVKQQMNNPAEAKTHNTNALVAASQAGGQSYIPLFLLSSSILTLSANEVLLRGVKSTFK